MSHGKTTGQARLDNNSFQREQELESLVIKMNESMYKKSSNHWIELFMVGKLPNRRANHVSFSLENYFYIHGG